MTLCVCCGLHEPDEDGFCSDSCRRSEELLGAARDLLGAPASKRELRRLERAVAAFGG